MTISETFLDQGDIHPIDVVETVATHYEWDFDRVAENQIAMNLEGQWRSYALTLAWSPSDQTLRLLATWETDPPADRLPALYELLNRMNDLCWAGSFTWWEEEKLMVFRYGLVLAGDQVASPEQIDTMIHAALLSAERFYPAVQLALWGGEEPRRAMDAAIAEAFGRA
ncbi:YbjN domain-containing protein [Rubellimicrobium sp. CFH 75288]|uniref:YbjN domain-containing protein n=1 Tax=Rubellimicrobium sp. CFH 75288 TaxID=2697034 RepID=UPI0014133BBA|nr:YbjN domain-containing protein [Rubellimicrobium sp. CFH 75288]NAZ37444.1 diacylglyceryl transferase [Rubellimicrobium sp. CFH 75288]